MLSRQEQTKIYNEHKSYIMNYIRFKYPKYDAEAIYDDIMYRVITKIDQYNGNSNESFKKWIWAITGNVIIDHMRMNRRYYDNIITSETIAEKGYNTAHHNLVYGDYIKNLISFIPSQKQRNIFIDFIEGYTHKEIGKKYNITEKTSKGYICESRHIIKEKVQIFSWMSKYQ